MTIFGDGTQTRAFSYIDDVAPLIADAIDTPAAWNQTFNVGADQPYSLVALATAVASAMGVPPEIQHLEPRHEVQHAHSSHEKARAVFGARPSTSLAEGLARMAAWVRTHGARTSVPFEGIEITKNLPAAWQVR
jgi:UDP-glucose 4-epimerase